LGHSHSIINGPSKLLIRKALAAASKICTVIFAVNLSGTRIGAGFRVVRPKLTFRDLSASIDSDDNRQRHRRALVSVGEVPKKGRHQTPQGLSRITFRKVFYRRGVARAVKARDYLAKVRDTPN
jgi:hypothetical protein